MILKVADAHGGGSRDLFSPAVGVCCAPQWSPDGKSVSFVRGTRTMPNDLWVVSIKDGDARQITCSLPGGRLHDRLAEPQKVEYLSFDGLKINAYLYAPNDRVGEKQYPGILFIHGGPTSQFVDDLQPQVQYLVQRGYVVLMPNIRGSSGYGKTFEELNDGDWGHNDLKDVLAGADLLKGLRYVDSDNMGITGTSYGGIMSMCAVCFAPGAFQAAAPMSGYADWPALLHEVELRHIKLMEHEFGPYAQNADAWRRSSPIYAVTNATTPCLALHGEGGEPRSDASKNFVHVMRQHYKTVRYKTYPNEGYYVRSTKNLKNMLPDLADFFNQYLKDE